MRGLNSWRKAHFLASDIIASLLLTGLVVWWLYFTSTGASIYENVQGNSTNLFKTTATISGTLMGFSMTIVVLAITFWQTDWFDLIKEDERASQQIWATLRQTTWFLALLTGTSLVCMVVKIENEPARWTAIPYLATFSMAVARLLRSIWVIQKMTGIAVAAARNTTSER